MTDEIQVQEPESVTEEQQKPGRRLREAREAKGLSQQEVASQLRLQLRLIEALEEDDEEALPPATFVYGYLRSYARLLEIPEESVVPPPSSEPAPPLISTIASKGEATSRDWPARLVTYLVIAAIGVSVAMWWIAQRSDISLPVPGNEPEVVSPGESVSLALPESQTSPSRDAESQINGDEPVEKSPTEGAPEEGTDSVEPAMTEQSNNAVPEPAPAPAPALAQEPAPAQTSAKVSSSNGVPPLTNTTPQSNLELRYDTDSWTEVYDSAGRQLTYGLVKAGQVLELKGEAPFRVFLGYATGVKVYYNGELFDHTPFQRRDVARFRIGRAEHNHPISR